MSLFELKNIYFRYDKYAKDNMYNLSNISFSVNNNDIISIIGKSGCGKSTLISHLNGILKADSGEIYYNGNNIYDDNFDLKRLRFECGVVYQYPEYQLFSETVIDDVSFGAIKKGLTKDEAYDKSIKILDMLGISHLKNESPFVLSGGEKRKVALAGVLVMEPKVLILDEPEAGLDVSSKKYLFSLLKDLNKKNGVTIIFVTHDVDDALLYSNKTLIINNGTVVAFGDSYDVLSNNNLMSSYGLKMPVSIELIYKLNKKGAMLSKDSLDFDMMVDNLSKIIKC